MQRNIEKLFQSSNPEDVMVAVELLKTQDLSYEEWLEYFRLRPYLEIAYVHYMYRLKDHQYAVLTSNGTFWLPKGSDIPYLYPDIEIEDLNIKYNTWKEKTLNMNLERMKYIIKRYRESLKENTGSGMKKPLEK